jgi:hypothetical protein
MADWLTKNYQTTIVTKPTNNLTYTNQNNQTKPKQTKSTNEPTNLNLTKANQTNQPYLT